jgi:hypothetical protein
MLGSIKWKQLTEEEKITFGLAYQERDDEKSIVQSDSFFNQERPDYNSESLYFRKRMQKMSGGGRSSKSSGKFSSSISKNSSIIQAIEEMDKED